MPLSQALLAAPTLDDGLAIAGAAAGFDTLEMALVVNASRADAGALLVKLDDVARDFRAAARAIVAFLAAPFSAGGGGDAAPDRAFRATVRARAAALERRFLAFDLADRGADARAYQAFDALVAKHASSKAYEAAARARLADLLCGDARDAEFRAVLAPALALLRTAACPTP